MTGFDETAPPTPADADSIQKAQEAEHAARDEQADTDDTSRDEGSSAEQEFELGGDDDLRAGRVQPGPN